MSPRLLGSFVFSAFVSARGAQRRPRDLLKSYSPEEGIVRLGVLTQEDPLYHTFSNGVPPAPPHTFDEEAFNSQALGIREKHSQPKEPTGTCFCVAAVRKVPCAP